MRQVQWHEGGVMFAGDETYYPAGWYLYCPLGTCKVEQVLVFDRGVSIDGDLKEIL